MDNHFRNYSYIILVYVLGTIIVLYGQKTNIARNACCMLSTSRNLFLNINLSVKYFISFSKRSKRCISVIGFNIL